MEPRQCKPCREQNLECTGEEPKCIRCISSGNRTECFYPAPPVAKRRAKLARHRACEPCKRKKRKCDGVRPQCGTCGASGGVCTWDNSHQRPSGKLRKIMPLEPDSSHSGETQPSQHHPPVPSISYLPPSEQPGHLVPVYDVVSNDFPGMAYPDQSFGFPVMSLSDPYIQVGPVDPSFFVLPDIPSSDMDLNFFIPPSFD